MAVLWALNQDRTTFWSVSEIAGACHIPYSTAYAVLQRLWSDGRAARVQVDGKPGQTKVWFELTASGHDLIRKVLPRIPDPVAALHALDLSDI